MAEETKVAKKATAKKASSAKAEAKVEKAPVAKQTKAAPKAKETKVEAPKAEAKVEKEVKVEKAPAKKASKGHAKASETNRLKEKYLNEIKGHLMEKYHYSSIMQVPALEKIVINVGVGDATSNSKTLDDSVRELGQITGQHPVTTKAKKSIASFKLREGQAIGCKVTLRGIRMYEFFDKLVSIALPRVRDFRGVSKNAFDGHGNYTLGVKEQLIFPEIDYDKVNKIRGMDVVIVTTAKSDDEAFALLKELGIPFHK